LDQYIRLVSALQAVVVDLVRGPRYVEHPEEDHLLSEPAWTRAWNNVLEWFELFLEPPRG
jgi:hypothetical protein